MDVREREREREEKAPKKNNKKGKILSVVRGRRQSFYEDADWPLLVKTCVI